MNLTVTEPSEGKSGSPAKERSWLTGCNAKGILKKHDVNRGVRAYETNIPSVLFSNDKRMCLPSRIAMTKSSRPGRDCITVPKQTAVRTTVMH